MLLPSIYNIQSEITNLRVNDDYLFFLDESLNITMIDVQTKSLIRDFKIDDTIFSLYNECYIVCFDSSSQVVNYYNFEGKILINETIDDDIEITAIKGDKKRMIFYDAFNFQIKSWPISNWWKFALKASVQFDLMPFSYKQVHR